MLTTASPSVPDTAPKPLLGDLVPLTKMTGANDENRVAVWVNRHHVTHIEQYREWNRFMSERNGAEHTYIYFGETLLKVEEPLHVVAIALQTGQLP